MNISASMLQPEAAGLGQRRTGTLNQIGKRKARILVVDDDPGLLRLLTIRLRAESYDVEAVESTSVVFAFREDRRPAQSSLRALEREEFE